MEDRFISNMLTVMISPCEEDETIVIIWTAAGGRQARMNVPLVALEDKKSRDAFVIMLLDTIVNL